MRVGDRVRVALAGRRVGGWVTEVGVEPMPGVELRPIARWSGRGPTPDLLALADWAAWRWAGRPASFLRTASPERVVARLPAPARRRSLRGSGGDDGGDGSESGDALVDRLATGALGHPRAVLRIPPAAPAGVVAVAAAGRGNALVLCPTAAQVREVSRRLRAAGVPVAVHPDGWAQGVAGATVVGTRAAAWAPVADLAAVVVLDEHDEAHRQEQAPTWHARDVAAERARREGVPCLLTSACPSLEALGWGRLVAPARAEERAGWPIVDAVDMRRQDPHTGLLTPPLVRLLRSDRRVLCVLNRTGRARLLACAACGELARCERCDAAVAQPSPDELACARCGTVRPVVCAACGAGRLKALRQGVTRVRDEIAALVGEDVDEVTAATPRGDGPATRVVVGTEATLHQVDEADVVAFLDADQELLAPRYRAAEQALALFARAARVVGGKQGGGRLVVQTFVPRHEVVQAVLHGDPDRVARTERGRRELLRFPPVTALAEVSGPAAARFVEALDPSQAAPADGAGEGSTSTLPLDGTGGEPAGGGDGSLALFGGRDDEASMTGTGGGDGSAPPGAGAVEVLGPADGRWLVRAPDHRTLCDALAAVPRPPGRLRVAVDPERI